MKKAKAELLTKDGQEIEDGVIRLYNPYVERHLYKDFGQKQET